jgi:membrane-associated phospholipid phosphatase
MEKAGRTRKIIDLIPLAGSMLFLFPCLVFASNGGQKSSGASLLLALAVAFLILYLSILLILSLVVRQARPLFRFAGSVFGSIKQALAENPDVKDLIGRHPRFFPFLARRLDRDRFSGLTLTILGLCFTYALVQFLGVVQSLLAADPIVAADLRLANLLSTFRTPDLTRFFLLVTLLGKWQVVVTFSAAATGILLLWRKWTYIPSIWLCVAGASITTWLGKITFHRQRPAVAEYVEWSYSFPSGHAVIAVAMYGFFIYLAWRLWQKRKTRLLALFAGTTVILAIGTSRLYLGVHYLSDVWGGYLLGLMWLLVGVSLSEAAVSRFPAREPSFSSGTLKKASWLICLLALCIYTALGATYNPPGRKQASETPKVITYDVASIFTQNSLSRYTETITGKSQEPISFVIAAASDNMLIKAFEAAGWTLVREPWRPGQGGKGGDP